VWNGSSRGGCAGTSTGGVATGRRNDETQQNGHNWCSVDQGANVVYVRALADGLCTHWGATVCIIGCDQSFRPVLGLPVRPSSRRLGGHWSSSTMESTVIATSGGSSSLERRRSERDPDQWFTGIVPRVRCLSPLGSRRVISSSVVFAIESLSWSISIRSVTVENRPRLERIGNDAFYESRLIWAVEICDEKTSEEGSKSEEEAGYSA
jgi:hypothetical protein